VHGARFFRPSRAGMCTHTSVHVLCGVAATSLCEIPGLHSGFAHKSLLPVCAWPWGRDRRLESSAVSAVQAGAHQP
jgi:hypothetical protein